MSNYAIIRMDNFLVENVCVWDGVSEWEAPNGTIVIKLEEGEACSPEWAFLPNSPIRFVNLNEQANP